MSFFAVFRKADGMPLTIRRNAVIGESFSHYKIVEKLGEGGMGVVYKAEDTKLDRLVALKFLPAHLASSPQDKARFVQEAKAASAINHPNVCTIHSIEEHEGRLFIVMEFVDGQTLRARRESVTFKQAIDIGIQIAEGLAAAHEKGIVHRDLKPENIMIRRDGIAQIMDFGLAKLRASGSAVTRLTKEGSTVGTAGYMSPEQVQGLDTDHRSDIFSYGVLLYELLAGQLPFKGVHETALAYEIVNVDPAPMSSIKPEIDPSLDAIVLECLEKDPRERTQSIAQTALDLKRFRRESSKQRMSRITAARPVADARGVQSGPADAGRQDGRPAARGAAAILPWGAALLFLTGFAALAFIHFREAPPETPSINASIVPPAGYTFNADVGGHLALSPDGTMLAFVATDSAGRNSLWVRPLNSPMARQLAETDGASFPFWSPDNKSIGFFVPGKLKRIAAMGGPAIVVCDAPNGRGGTWNQEGVILFSPNLDLVGIYRVSASGGTPTAVTRVDTSRNETNHRWPWFLPDGKHFLYATQANIRTPDFTGAIRVAALDSSVDKLVVKASSNMAYARGNVLYVRQKSIVAQPFDLSALDVSGDAVPVADKVEYSGDKSRGVFAVSGNGVLTYQSASGNTGLLMMADRSGRKVRDVGSRTVSVGARLSADGTRVAFDSNDPEVGTQDIWIYDLTRNITTRFTFDQSSEYAPVWSPDGTRLLYSADRQGSGDLYVKNANGTESEQVFLKDQTPKEPSDWSRDGRYILYRSFGSNTTYWDLMTAPTAGDRKPSPFLQTKFAEEYARFSPDGRWVAYESDESGKTEVYVRPFPSGEGKWQVSTNGGGYPVWGRDGKRIYYNLQTGGLVAVEVNGTGSAFVVGKATELFTIPRSLVFDVSPGDAQFLVGVVPASTSQQAVTLITNWDRELRNK